MSWRSEEGVALKAESDKGRSKLTMVATDGNPVPLADWKATKDKVL